jgi:hypothetical protein
MTQGFLVLTALSWLTFVLMPPPTGHSIEFQRLPDMLVYALRVLGSSPATTIAAIFDIEPSRMMFAAAIIGAALAIAGLFLVWVEAVKTPPAGPGLGAAAIILFALGTAAMIGAGRATLHPDLALASRYTLVSATLILGVGALSIQFLAKSSMRMQCITTTLLALAFSLVPASAPALIADGAKTQIALARAQTALVVGSNRVGALTAVVFPPELLLTAAPDLRVHAKSLFWNRWSRSLGERVSLTSVVRRCGGNLRISAPFANEPGFARIQGRVDAAEIRRGRIIVIADSHGMMTGYGLAPKRASDLLSLIAAPAEDYAWVGTTLTSDNMTYRAYLASPERILCQIGDPASAPRRNAP